MGTASERAQQEREDVLGLRSLCLTRVEQAPAANGPVTEAQKRGVSRRPRFSH